MPGGTANLAPSHFFMAFEGVLGPHLASCKMLCHLVFDSESEDLVLNSHSMSDWLAGKSCPACRCAELRQADPSGPTVVVDGTPHVAAAQGTLPWPESEFATPCTVAC